MIEIHRVGGNDVSSSDVIFLHGLEGDWSTTWSSTGPEGSWPSWLAADIAGVAVWCVRYPASSTRWRGDSMPIRDRATSLLGALSNARDIGRNPFVLIGHSLGGLLIKQIVRHSSTMGDQYAGFADQLAGVVFFSTPHTGSGIASLASHFKKVRATPLVKELAKDQAYLRELDDWYRNYAVRKSLPNLSFYEKQKTSGIHVVGESSGDPHLPGMTAIPVDADHLTICKFLDHSDPVYLQVKRFVSTQIEHGCARLAESERANHARHKSRQATGYIQDDRLEIPKPDAEEQGSVKDGSLARDGSSRGIRARRINAHNVVQGIQIKGAASDIIGEVVPSIQRTHEGSIEADDINAYSVVSGLQYTHPADGTTLREMYTELQDLRKELVALSVSGNFSDDQLGQKVLRLAEDLSTELQSSHPDERRVVRDLRMLSDDLSWAARVYNTAGEVSVSIARCTSKANMLWRWARYSFEI